MGGRDVVVGLVGVGMADIEAIVVHVVSRNERLHVTINDLWYKEECKREYDPNITILKSFTTLNYHLPETP